MKAIARAGRRAASLVLEGVTLSYGREPVVEGVSLEVRPGSFAGLIGPNSSGKSTLIKAASRFLRPLSGRILLDGQDIWRDLGQIDVARRVAVVPQDFPAGFPFTVRETVTLGRIPYVSRLGGEKPSDLARVREALRATGTAHLADSLIAELAGGDRQRVVVAKALAQDPRLLLLDEPTSHLDVSHQVEILDLLLRLNRSTGLTVVIVLHDLNQAAIYCDHLYLLTAGRVAAEGTPDEVLTAGVLREVYGGRVLVGQHPLYGCPQVTLVSGLKVAEKVPAVSSPASAPGPAADPEAAASPEAARCASFTVHVVAGGGSSSDLLDGLAAAGFTVTAGPLNAGDSDWEMGRSLGLEMVSLPPFSPIDEPAARTAEAMMGLADAILVGPVPFGAGNVGILDKVGEALRKGIPVGVVGGGLSDIASRDFTGGRASRLENGLAEAGAVRLHDVREAVGWATALASRREVRRG